MTYQAPGPMTFRRTGGDLDQKICNQLALVDAEIDAAEARISTLEGGSVQYAAVSLTGGAANAFCMAWLNPVSGTILIKGLAVRITTAGGTATAVLDFGTGATATTHSDNLIDGLDANAAGLADNITNKGSNGKTLGVLTTGQYLTGQILTEAATALVGKAVIFYVPI